MYILLGLKLSPSRWGAPDDDSFPLLFEVDYVRLYQVSHDPRQPEEVGQRGKGRGEGGGGARGNRCEDPSDQASSNHEKTDLGDCEGSFVPCAEGDRRKQDVRST